MEIEIENCERVGREPLKYKIWALKAFLIAGKKPKEKYFEIIT